jgi:anti-sigma B factor antagonist
VIPDACSVDVLRLVGFAVGRGGRGGPPAFTAGSANPQGTLSVAGHETVVAIDWEDAYYRMEFFTDLGQGDDLAILVLTGDLNSRTAPQLEVCTASLGAGAPLHLLLDLEHLTVCDADGIAALVAVCGQIRSEGGSASVICASRVARRALEVAGVFGYLTNGDAKEL